MATDHLIPTPEELASRIYAAVVSDALDAAGAEGRILAPRIRPVLQLAKAVVGRAATARSVPVERPPARPYGALLEAMDRLRPGELLVIGSDGAGAVGSAIFGGLLATAACARGAVGCVVDGAVRDTRELVRLRFPTFAAGFSPADSFGRDEVVEHGAPVCCGDVEVHPGELVVADHDGIVVIPAALEEEVVAFALRKVAGEGDMRKELAAGLSASEAFTKYGIL